MGKNVEEYLPQLWSELGLFTSLNVTQNVDIHELLMVTYLVYVIVTANHVFAAPKTDFGEVIH